MALITECTICGGRNGCVNHFHLGPKYERLVSVEETTMPRGPIIVTLADGKDHLIIGTEVTGCGQLVPFGLEWQTSTTKPCKTCFPDGKVTAARTADESALIARQQEALGVEPVAERAPFEEGVVLAAPTVEEPEPTDEPKAASKSAKKATKAG